MVKFHRDVIAAVTYTIKFESTPLSGDVSGDMMLTQSSYEPLVIGDMTVLFEAKWDRDIYEFTNEQQVDLQFFRDVDVTICEITAPGVRDCKWESELFTLAPGTHYFMFETLSHLPTYTVNVRVEMLMDLSDENHKIPVELGVPFDVIIERDGDLDYYTFEITEHQFIDVLIENGHPSLAEIYNDQGLMIQEIYYGQGIVELMPGSYVLVIGENISDAHEIYHFIVHLDPIAIADPDPYTRDFPVEYYREFTLPIDYENRITGTIDYEDDIDYFRIVITTPGSYVFSISDSTKLYAYLYDSDGQRERLFQNYHYDLVEGTYYLQVYGSSSFTVNSDYYVIFR